MTHKAQTELVSFTVRLGPETAERLRKIAEREDRSVAAELRRAVEAHVARHETGP
jgi:predicted transcriptional regulator